MKKLSKEEMKKVMGGIPPGFSWIYCNCNGTISTELCNCTACHCNSGCSFVRFGAPGCP